MDKGGGKIDWVLMLLILAGVVLGGFVGETVGSVPFLQWLGYGKQFGLTSPLVLDLGVLVLNFGITVKFTIAGIIGIILAVFIYRKM